MNINMKKLTTSDFIEKAKKIHGDKYDYSKVDYVNNKTKVCIVCPEHSEFYQRPNDHINGSICFQCSINKLKKNNTSSTSEFIKKAKKVHNNKYDYSKTEYISSQEKVCIICPEHGEFYQRPSIHLQGQGCSKCGYENISIKKKLTINEWVNKANIIHNNKYDYSKVDYRGSKEKVCIICPEHGEFWQESAQHLYNGGCSKCNKRNKQVVIKNNLIKKSKEVHGDKYDYSKVEYAKWGKKVCIICPEHGEFWQDLYIHSDNHGCPVCNESKLEKKIRILLKENNINFIGQCKPNFLENGKSKLSLDFYLPDYNIAIECQGEQHFISKDFFGGNKEFLNIKKRDKLKQTMCEKNSIHLIYYSESNKNIIPPNYYNIIYTNINDLINHIKKNTKKNEFSK